MINISQHAFVPREKNIDGYYSLAGTLQSGNYASTTLRQRKDVYNCFQLFGNYAPTGGNWLSLRIFNPNGSSSSEGTNIGSTNTGYQSPLLKKLPTVYTSSAFTFRKGYYHGLPVVAVMWYETPGPALSTLSLGNTLSPDVIDNEEEYL